MSKNTKDKKNKDAKSSNKKASKKFGGIKPMTPAQVVTLLIAADAVSIKGAYGGY